MILRLTLTSAALADTTPFNQKPDVSRGYIDVSLLVGPVVQKQGPARGRPLPGGSARGSSGPRRYAPSA